MTTWAIGDIQGCFGALQRLVQAIDFQPGRDTLWIAGDLVNRGPKSLRTLRWAMRNEGSVRTVLGNHDLHLLALHAGIRRARKGDTLGNVLKAEDRSRLMDWLRAQPLMVRENGHAMIHAGLLPAWTLDHAEALARDAENALRADDWTGFLQQVFDRSASPGSAAHAANVFTTLRFVTPDGVPETTFKGAPERAPEGLRPWYADRDDPDVLLFGHWAAHGLRRTPRWIALDSGCVWGNALSAVSLDDARVFQVSAK